MSSIRRFFGQPPRRRRMPAWAGHGGRRVPQLEPLERRELLAGDLALTEFMASNDTTLPDGDGNWPDWIEIHNAGAGQASLAGWTLTDDAGDLKKWEFPDRTLESDQYLVVFASAQNRVVVDGELHTNFKLRADGEYIALVSPAGVVVSEYGTGGSDYPPQSTDVSYGLPADVTTPGFLTAPTPGEPNSPTRIASVEFDRPSGMFQDPFSLALTADTPGATIRYTTDGSEPISTSSVYTDPIDIASTTHVQAIAMVDGSTNSTISSAWFVTIDADLTHFTSDLPIIVLENFSHGRPPLLSLQFNAMAIFEPDAVSGRSSLADTPTVETRSGVKVRGSSTNQWEKAPYRLETWDDRNDDKDLSLLGMPSESDWILYSPFQMDRAMLHNPFIFDLSNQVGRYAMRTRYVEVYHNMDGGDVSSLDYRGVYVLMEKIKRGPDRVDVQELEPQHDQEPEITGGWMLKIGRNDPGESGFADPNFHALNIWYIDPKEADVTDVQAAWIEDHIGAMSGSLSDTDPETGYAQYIDVDSWIDHHLLNVLAANIDALRLSTYFYKDRGGKIEYGPIWDFDRSMESADDRDDSPYGNFSSLFSHNKEYPWWGVLFEDPNFKQSWIDRWFELRGDVLSEANIGSTIDSLAGEIEEAQERNFDRWIGFPPRTTSPVAFDVGALDGTWEGEVAHMKAWLFTRVAWIDSQFVSPPTITPGGGRVVPGQEITMSGGSDSVYYTTDGSDPRLPGGDVSGNAILFDDSAPIVFSEAVSIVARAMSEGQWSAPVAAQFRVAGATDDARGLAITEINYHPYGPTDAERLLNASWNSNAFEFIELMNAGGHTIDLADVAFVDGVDFTFGSDETSHLTPGAHVLVVANQDAFEARYGTELPVAGEFVRGSLSNGGEQITLADRLGTVIQDFQYDDTRPWPDRADGTGSTLERIDVASHPDVAENWRASSQYGGSPGRMGTEPISDVVLNEVLTRGEDGEPDLIELHNRTSHNVGLSGWYLTDDKDQLRKAVLPDATTIAAGEYLVLGAAALGFDLNGTTGGDLWLIEADGGGRPVRFVDRLEFGAAAVGVALGRWPDGDPEGTVLPMKNPSFGTANSGPRTGEMVISEVHYLHPEVLPIVAEDFADGTVETFTPVFGEWVVRDGGYEVTPGDEGDTIATLETEGPLPTNFTFSATLNARTVPDHKLNAAIIFDYHGPTDFKFVSMHAGGGKWRIGQRDASGWNVLAEFSRGILADTDTYVRIEVRGSSVTLRSAGTLASPGPWISYDFGTPLSAGQLGLGSKGGTARFDQVVLEWMGDSRNIEFVELVGTAGAPIDLAGWHIEDRDAVRLTFAPGTTVGVGGAIVVVNFDPADAVTAALFRETFGIDESVVLTGPYRGSLNDEGDVLRLVKPVAFEDENPGFVLVDQVAYDDQSPWPTAADGQGRALSRGAAEAVGHFASSWSALVPTPGTVQYARTGDMNFDGTVDVTDIDAFAQTLAGSHAYLATYGRPATMVADVDGDGDVDFDDINNFVALVGGGVPASVARADGGTDVEVAMAGPALPGADALPAGDRQLRPLQVARSPVAASSGSRLNEWRSRRDAGLTRRFERQDLVRNRSGRHERADCDRSRNALADRVLEAESVWLDPLVIRFGRSA